ncbi:cell envelope integrity protein TolA [Paraburkholderia sediminicola]|uniref:cell envelope integrity protein TolA n=1 Tax=Paraburkholderia sediminicola TaxID=458836 RepID=UPI0038BBB5DD
MTFPGLTAFIVFSAPFLAYGQAVREPNSLPWDERIWRHAGFTLLKLPQLGDTSQFLAKTEISIVPGVQFAPPVYPKSASEPLVPSEADIYAQTTNIATGWLSYGSLFAIGMWINSQREGGIWDFKKYGKDVGGDYSLRLSDAGNFVNGLTGEILFSREFLALGTGGVKVMTNLVKNIRQGSDVDYGLWWSGPTHGGKPRGWILEQMGYDYSESGEVVRQFIDEARPLPAEMGGPGLTYGQLRRSLARSADQEIEKRSKPLEDAALKYDARLYQEMKQQDKQRAEEQKQAEIRAYQEALEQKRRAQLQLQEEERQRQLAGEEEAMRSQQDADRARYFSTRPTSNIPTTPWSPSTPPTYFQQSIANPQSAYVPLPSPFIPRPFVYYGGHIEYAPADFDNSDERGATISHP